jgi:hypothetical protein
MSDQQRKFQVEAGNSANALRQEAAKELLHQRNNWPVLQMEMAPLSLLASVLPPLSIVDSEANSRSQKLEQAG